MKIEVLCRVTWVSLLVLMLSGCVALELRDANEQLTSYYNAKIAARQAKDFVMTDTALSQLKSLAQAAAAQAKEESDPLNRIAYYRIAATAAWQAGDPAVAEYGLAGQALCHQGDPARAPRDCGMLMVIPSLASVDEQTPRLNQLQARISEPSWRDNAEDRAAAEKIFGALRDAFDNLARQRPTLRDSAVHPTFMQGLDSNLGILLCDHLDSSVRGVLGIVNSPRLPELARSVHDMECTLLKQGVDQRNASCIKDVDPQTCL